MNPNESVQPTAPENPYVPYPGAGGAALTTNPQGRVALGVGLAIVVLAAVSSVLSWSMPRMLALYGYGAAHASTVMMALGALQGVLAICALATGIAGLRLAGAPKGAAGAGTAIGAWALLTLLLAWLPALGLRPF